MGALTGNSPRKQSTTWRALEVYVKENSLQGEREREPAPSVHVAHEVGACIHARRLLLRLGVDDPDNPAAICELLGFLKAEVATLRDPSVSLPTRRARLVVLREMVRAAAVVSQ